VTTDGYYDRVAEAAAYIRTRVPKLPEIAVVLGSGLGDYAGTLKDAISLKYEDIPHWPSASVIGHAGKVVAGRAAGGRAIFALAGRAHFYEGYDLRTVTFNTRVLGLLGVGDDQQRRRRHQYVVRAGRADADQRSHQPDRTQST